MSEVKIPWAGWKAVKALGQGGFGSVYEIQRSIGGMIEKSAMKVMHIPSDSSAINQYLSDGYSVDQLKEHYLNVMKRLMQEYKFMMSVKGQSNIVYCEDYAIDEHPDGIGWDLYIRMELLTPLDKVIKAEGVSEELALKVGIDICQALIFCHQNKIVHRDIKGDNILRSRFGSFKLGDFGISRIMEHTTAASKAGTGIYMAPEVVKQEKYGHKVDIYSLGLVLYTILNHNRIPFLPLHGQLTGMDYNKAMARRIAGEPIPAPAQGSDAIKKVILKACAYHPDQRYESAEAMLKDLKAVASGLSARNAAAPKASPVSPQNRPQGHAPAQSPVRPQEQAGAKSPDSPRANVVIDPQVIKKAVSLEYELGNQPSHQKVGYQWVPGQRMTGLSLGMHLGYNEITLASCSASGVNIIGVVPGTVAFTEIGEILIGQQAHVYSKLTGATVYSVYALLKNRDWRLDTRFPYHGFTFSMKEVLHALMKKVREYLDQKGYQQYNQMDVAVTAMSYHAKLLLSEVLSENGFHSRITSTVNAAACYKGMMDPKKHALMIVDHNAVEFSLVESGEGVVEILYTIHLPGMGGYANPYDAVKAHVAQDAPSYYQELFAGRNYQDLRSGTMGNYEFWIYGDEDAKKSMTDAPIKVGTISNLSAGGAALRPALRAAVDYRPYAQNILLDATPHSFSVEVVGQKEEILLSKVHMLDAQSSFPASSDNRKVKPDTKYPVSRNLQDKLRVYVETAMPNPMVEVFWISLGEVYKQFKVLPSMVTLALALDAQEKMMITLSDANHPENRVEYPLTSGSMSGTPFGRYIEKMEHSTAVSMASFKEVAKAFLGLRQDLKAGIVLFSKQIDDFFAKYGIKQNVKSYAQFEQLVDRNRNMSLGNVQQMIVNILEVLDNMEYGLRSLAKNPEDPSYLVLSKYYEQLTQICFTHFGLVPIMAIGSAFDPTYHNAVETKEIPGEKPGMIVQEYLRGYRFDNELFRPSAVVVSK